MDDVQTTKLLWRRFTLDTDEHSTKPSALGHAQAPYRPSNAKQEFDNTMCVAEDLVGTSAASHTETP